MIESAPLGLLVEVLELWEFVDPATVGLTGSTRPLGSFRTRTAGRCISCSWSGSTIARALELHRSATPYPEKGSKGRDITAPAQDSWGGLRSLCELGGIAG